MAASKHSPNNEAGDGRAQKSVGYNGAQITEKESLKRGRNKRQAKIVISVDVSTQNVSACKLPFKISKYLAKFETD